MFGDVSLFNTSWPFDNRLYHIVMWDMKKIKVYARISYGLSQYFLASRQYCAEAQESFFCAEAQESFLSLQLK